MSQTRNAALCFALLVSSAMNGATGIYAPINSGAVSALNISSGKQTVLLVAGNPNNSVFVSPSGKTLFILASRKTILAVDAGTGQTIRTYTTTYPAFNSFLNKNAFAVSPDETTLVVGTCAFGLQNACQQGYVEALNAITGVETGIVFVGEEVSGIAVSADNKTAYATHFFDFVCPGCDPKPQGSSIPSNALSAFSLPRLTPGKSVAVPFAPGALAVSRDGSLAYVGSPIGLTGLAQVTLPDLTITRYTDQLQATRLALSADGTLLSIGQPAYNSSSPFDRVTFYQAPAFVLIGSVSLPYYIGYGLAADPQGRYAYTGFTGSVYQIDSQTLSVVTSLSTGAVTDLAIANSGGVLYPLLHEGSVIASFPEGSVQPAHLLTTATSSTLTLSPGGQILYTTPLFPLSGIVPVTVGGRRLATFETNHSFTSAAINSAGTKLFAGAGTTTGGSPFELLVVDFPSGKIQASVPLKSAPGGIAITPDQSKVVVNVGGGPLIYSVATGGVQTVSVTGGLGCAVSPSGKIAYLQSQSGNIAVVDLSTAAVVKTIPVLGGAIAFSPVAPVAFASGANGDIVEIDATTGDIITTISTTVSPQAMAITPDGRYVYATGAAGGASPGLVIDTSTLQVVGSLPASGPLAIQ